MGRLVGRGHIRHLGLVDEPGAFVDVERALQVEDGPAVLDGDDTAGREGTAVADAVDLIEDGRRRVAWAQEVRVQGMDAAQLDRPPGGHEGLGGDLAAEDAKSRLVEVLAPEDVHLDRLEVQQFDELAQGLGHGSDDRLILMASLVSRALAFRRTAHFKRLWKYASVSIISTLVTQVVLFLTYHV